MFYVENSSTDPYFNLAMEEFLFHQAAEPFFRVWQNESSVIIGKNQLLPHEVNIHYAKENDIKIVRRFSGGGAVYNDLGNFNLSFFDITNQFNFDSYNQLIIDFLQWLGLNPETDSRRAIYIGNLKISGSAQHIRGNRLIYHATLLFSSNLIHLQNILQGDEKIQPDAKHVKSVKSPVSNLSHFLPDISVNDFQEKIIGYFSNFYPQKFNPSNKMIVEINRLKYDKYKNIAWTETGKT